MFLSERGLLQEVGGVLHNLAVGLNLSSFILVVCGKYVNLSHKCLGQDSEEEVGAQLILNHHIAKVQKVGLQIHLSSGLSVTFSWAGSLDTIFTSLISSCF